MTCIDKILLLLRQNKRDESKKIRFRYKMFSNYLSLLVLDLLIFTFDWGVVTQSWSFFGLLQLPVELRIHSFCTPSGSQWHPAILCAAWFFDWSTWCAASIHFYSQFSPLFTHLTTLHPEETHFTLAFFFSSTYFPSIVWTSQFPKNGQTTSDYPRFTETLHIFLVWFLVAPPHVCNRGIARARLVGSFGSHSDNFGWFSTRRLRNNSSTSRTVILKGDFCDRTKF